MEAVKRDPSFFDAYCQLAYAHEQLLMQYGGLITLPPGLRLAGSCGASRDTVRGCSRNAFGARTISLQRARDYAGALANWRLRRRGLPNDPRLFESPATSCGRRGQQEEGLAQSGARGGLDPRNFNSAQIALSIPSMGRYAETIRCAGSRSAIVPEQRPKRAGQS